MPGATTPKTSHIMPFGAAVTDNGRAVRFRLWAPTAQSVELILYQPGGEQSFPLDKQADGWCELVTDQAKAGSLYAYRINGELTVPDPASRCQAEDVHGPSIVIDPARFRWQDQDWRGIPWEEAVLYELHVGTFSPEGSFKGVEKKLDHLVNLGVTAIELMPLADFPGKRNWGYDGVLLYAPDNIYGTPEDLKQLIQSAHRKGLMVFLDVVYNHFGPEGNYLHAYAKSFFNPDHQTPWGAAINFDGPNNRAVRDFFIHNAIYWLEEYRFDGLRFDAVHAIRDESATHILDELASKVKSHFGADRHIHLVLENDDNSARFLGAGKYNAQWDDDIHHVFHALASGEGSGYYSDYTEEGSGKSTLEHLGRTLSEGFAYQGEASKYRNGELRGEPSKHLPATAFVSFLQNHDQIGNRAFGDRLVHLSDQDTLSALHAILLLSPQIPMLYMGEEWGATTPFQFFCDFGPDLGPLVTEGRRKEFAQFPEFSDPALRDRIPDPCRVETFTNSRLDWSEPNQAEHQQLLAESQQLLKLRRERIIPLIRQLEAGAARYSVINNREVHVTWPLKDGSALTLYFSPDSLDENSIPADNSEEIYRNPENPLRVVWRLRRSL